MNNRILIIDDEEAVRESVKDTLDYEGFELYFAENGASGLAKYEEVRPTTVILDLRMPDMDGLELLQQIRLLPSDLCSVIILTGHGGDEDIEKSYEFGATSFLRKPFNIFELKGLVKNLCLLSQAKETLYKNYLIQSTINSILEASLQVGKSPEDKLKEILELILNNHLYDNYEKRGAIFLLNSDNADVRQTISIGLSDELIQQCANRMCLKHCFCKTALEIPKAIFVEKNSDPCQCSEFVVPASHYGVPIVAQDRVLGVLTVYVKENHQRNEEEEQFLQSASYAIAAVIQFNQIRN